MGIDISDTVIERAFFLIESSADLALFKIVKKAGCISETFS